MCMLYTGLEINFDEEDYSTDENDITGLSGISLSLRETQAPFRMELIPATIGVAESAEYDLTDFLSLDEILAEQHAKSGEMCVDMFHMFAYKGYTELYFDVLGLTPLIYNYNM